MSASTPDSTAEPGRTLLLVEDDKVTRHFLKMALDGSFAVEAVQTAEEALEAAQNETVTYDIFLLDISLRSGPGGGAILKALRALEAYRHTPAIAITAYHPDAAPEDFMAAGFDGYLRKPFYQHELLDLIDKLLTFDAE